MSDQDTILVAKRAALINHDGQTFIVKAGTTVRAGHPIVDGREGLFEPISVTYDLEQSTEAADLGLGVESGTPARRTKTETR